MADADSLYRVPRRRSGMDPNTKRLALIAGGIGGALVVLVGAWSLTGQKSGGVPIVEADSRPVRVKPEKSTGPEVDEPADAGKTGLAPTPEAPAPQALKAQAAAAAAAAAAAQAAAAPPAAPAVVAAKPPMASQPVALTSPVQPAPSAQAQGTPAAARPVAAASPKPAAQGGPQVQLAALQSEQAALAEWQRLEKRMPDVFGGRRPAVVKTERDGKTFWRLRTGGFTDASQATSFCDKVKAKGGNCSVASF